MPFGIPQYVQFILHGLASVLLCVQFIFSDHGKCWFVITHDRFLCNRNCSYISLRLLWSLITEVRTFQNSSRYILLCNRLNIADMNFRYRYAVLPKCNVTLAGISNFAEGRNTTAAFAWWTQHIYSSENKPYIFY